MSVLLFLIRLTRVTWIALLTFSSSTPSSFDVDVFVNLLILLVLRTGYLYLFSISSTDSKVSLQMTMKIIRSFLSFWR